MGGPLENSNDPSIADGAWSPTSSRAIQQINDVLDIGESPLKEIPLTYSAEKAGNWLIPVRSTDNLRIHNTHDEQRLLI